MRLARVRSAADGSGVPAAPRCRVKSPGSPWRGSSSRQRPFQRSPIDLISLPDLVDTADAVRSFIATVRTNPTLLMWLGAAGAPTGFLLWSAIRGTGRGLSAGLQYRLLKLFGVPDEIISRTDAATTTVTCRRPHEDEDELGRRLHGRPSLTQSLTNLTQRGAIHRYATTRRRWAIPRSMQGSRLE